MEFGTHHVCIKAADIEKSQRFYEEALRFAVKTTVHHTPAVTSCFMVSSDGLLELQLLNFPGSGGEHSGYGHLGMKVDDIRTAFTFHQAMGVISQEIVEQPHQFGYFIKDPDGYETEICQPK